MCDISSGCAQSLLVRGLGSVPKHNRGSARVIRTMSYQSAGRLLEPSYARAVGTILVIVWNHPGDILEPSDLLESFHLIGLFLFLANGNANSLHTDACCTDYSMALRLCSDHADVNDAVTSSWGCRA